jgi:hypothetical protein
MFNQNKNQNPVFDKNPTPNIPGQAGTGARSPEDIFESTEKIENNPGSVRRQSPPPVSSGINRNFESVDSGHGAGKYAVLGIMVLVLFVIGAGGYYAYTNLFNFDPLAENDLEQETMNKIPEGGLEDYEMPGFIDSDQDGLSDEEELRLGTDPYNVDTDNDGLFDYEEVKVYGTDPLNPDTDGDGYTDGEEVKSGFNPLGPGVLYGDEDRERPIKQIEKQTVDTFIDSDNDGLTDWEEINIYFTDPFNPDTDGDGFLDGDEVQNGYNPNGPGLLQ